MWSVPVGVGNCGMPVVTGVRKTSVWFWKAKSHCCERLTRMSWPPILGTVPAGIGPGGNDPAVGIGTGVPQGTGVFTVFGFGFGVAVAVAVVVGTGVLGTTVGGR